MNIDYIEDKYKLNPDKCVVHKKIKNNPSKKYTIIFTLFVLSLVLVSTIKNETRKLQKEVNDLQSTLRTIKINLHEAVLDNQVITSPENIAKLASEYLEENFTYYKKLQIKTFIFTFEANYLCKHLSPYNMHLTIFEHLDVRSKLHLNRV